MAGEVQFSYLVGATTYFSVRNAIGRIWNVSGAGAFEVFNATNYVSYAVSAVEQGSSAFYAGTFPTAIPAGVYGITAKNQVGASPAQSDGTIAVGDLQWNGTAALPLSDLATSGQIAINSPIKVYRGEMVRNFPFKLVSSADHVTPFTSGVVSGQIARDGSTFGPLQSGAFTEMGKGWYSLQALTSGDLTANTVAVLFTAQGVSGGAADQRDHSFILQRTSGY